MENKSVYGRNYKVKYKDKQSPYIRGNKITMNEIEKNGKINCGSNEMWNEIFNDCSGIESIEKNWKCEL